MSEPDLTPQEPGMLPGVDVSALQDLADGNVATLSDSLGALTDAELVQLTTLERAGKARTTALVAIQRESDARERPTQTEPAIEHTLLGDAQNYADTRWQDVDASKLRGPVLTADGWLHPAPSAHPVE